MHPRELGRQLGRRVEELLDPAPLGERPLPKAEAEDAVGAVRAEAVILHGHGATGERRLHAQSPKGVAEAVQIEVARAHVAGAARDGRLCLVVVDEHDAVGEHALRIVGEAQGRRHGGQEGQAGGAVGAHGRRGRPAAHGGAAEDHCRAAGGGGPYLAGHHLRA